MRSLRRRRRSNDGLDDDSIIAGKGIGQAASGEQRIKGGLQLEVPRERSSRLAVDEAVIEQDLDVGLPCQLLQRRCKRLLADTDMQWLRERDDGSRETADADQCDCSGEMPGCRVARAAGAVLLSTFCMISEHGCLQGIGHDSLWDVCSVFDAHDIDAVLRRTAGAVPPVQCLGDARAVQHRATLNGAKAGENGGNRGLVRHDATVMPDWSRRHPDQ